MRRWARCIYAVSFLTTGDERQFDPVCWEIDGPSAGEKGGRRIQTSENPMHPNAIIDIEREAWG